MNNGTIEGNYKKCLFKESNLLSWKSGGRMAQERINRGRRKGWVKVVFTVLAAFQGFPSARL